MSQPFPQTAFPQSWSAEILRTPPLIAPARAFVYPQNIPGEEDALARGALHLLVHPRTGGAYLATCALGFTDQSLPTAVHPCPNPDQLCALAGGYAYLSDTTNPETCALLPLKPVAAVQAVPEANLLLFLGLHTLLAWGPEGLRWQTSRLTWEGLRLTEITATHAQGLGWDLYTDREIPFTVDLATGRHTGSPFPPSSETSATTS
jgi:hypothetical protein